MVYLNDFELRSILWFWYLHEQRKNLFGYIILWFRIFRGAWLWEIVGCALKHLIYNLKKNLPCVGNCPYVPSFKVDYLWDICRHGLKEECSTWVLLCRHNWRLGYLDHGKVSTFWIFPSVLLLHVWTGFDWIVKTWRHDCLKTCGEALFRMLNFC